jgi:hypothetical protein
MGVSQNTVKTLIFGLLIWLMPLISFGQSIQKELDNGKKVILEVTPIGHRVTDSKWLHTYEIYKSNSEYIVILKQDKEIFKKVLTKKDLKPFISYIKLIKSKSKKHYGLPQDGIIITINKEKYHFSTSFKSDVQLLDFMHKDNQSNPIKMGIR